MEVQNANLIKRTTIQTLVTISTLSIISAIAHLGYKGSVSAYGWYNQLRVDNQISKCEEAALTYLANYKLKTKEQHLEESLAFLNSKHTEDIQDRLANESMHIALNADPTLKAQYIRATRNSINDMMSATNVSISIEDGKCKRHYY